ncbi:MAG: Lrp/AsnC ligand binding domain-containing protein [Paludibacter sp.]|nr:Lrp/AsnC ligand binding domain-containing protein [Paludibacter sp.]
MSKQKLDLLDKKILTFISADARIPFLEIARECGVSGAAVHQRVQKLKKHGIIEGSEFLINNYRIGYQTCAFVGINLLNTCYANGVIAKLREIPEIVECHFATGRFAMFVKIYARDNHNLLQIIVDKITQIEGIINTETFQMSLEEIFRRQISNFETIEYSSEEEANEEAAEEDLENNDGLDY